jgi:uncharacterized low-complexity protein
MFRTLAVAALLLGVTSAAQAEYRTFIISNQPGEYGVDQCLSTGARCGNLVADAFCQSNSYAKAKTFRPAESTDVTASVTPASTGNNQAAQLIAIECER